MRAVVDPNVIISGALSPGGAPAGVLRALAAGDFELIASQALLDELRRALGYPKLRSRIGETQAAELVRWIAEQATLVADPLTEIPVRSPDPDDDYLIALAFANRAALVSGDGDLLVLAKEIPVLSARAFLELLAASGRTGPT